MKKLVILGAFLVVFVALPAKASVHSEGQNVLNNGTIYTISSGQLRPYTSAGAFLSYGFNSWNNVVQASAEDMNLPVGAFLPPRDGKIVCSDRGEDKGTCYLITDGMKAGFTSEQVFTELGYSFKYALYGDVSFLTSTGNISDSTKAHLSGTLINDNNVIKLVSKNGLVGVPDMSVLNSWGYSLVDVVPANAEDSKLAQSEVLAPKAGGQLTPDVGTVDTPTPTPTPVPAQPVVRPELVGATFAEMTKTGGYIYNSVGGRMDPMNSSNTPSCWNQGSAVLQFNKPVSVKVKLWTPYLSVGTDNPKFALNGDQIEQKLNTGDLDSEIITTDAVSLGNFQYVCYTGLGMTPGFNYMIGVEATDSSGNIFKDWITTGPRYYPR